jgi:hypothetical protein
MPPKMFGRPLGFALPLAIVLLIALTASLSLRADSDPWAKTQTIQPAELAKELGDPKTAPTVVFVGFKRLYSAGHIKGAEYHGTAGSEEGLKELTTWAAGLPRSTNLVIYCVRLLPDGALPEHPAGLQGVAGTGIQESSRADASTGFRHRLGGQRPPLRQRKLGRNSGSRQASTRNQGYFCFLLTY